ncbi:MAG: hypothetical protein Q7K54_03555 [Candidatus Parcubacteria bacterium]|nr:hypothetical protein [Candidatus Parcubacteria bacterium]
MYNIVFYDLSHSSRPKNIESGTRLSITELIAVNLQIESLPNQIRQMMTSLKIADIDPLGVERSSRWEGLMSAIIYCLCGQMPLRQEVLRGRQIMMALSKNLRTRVIAEEIAFSLLPYILIGFKTHLEDQFQSDSNTVADVATFLAHLHNTPNPRITSFLCAHRGKSNTEKHILSESVQTQKAQVALNLIKGMLANDPWAKTRSVRWYQQGPTEWACMNMFPEIFLRYMTSGQVPLLLTLLEKHFFQLQEMMGVTDLNQVKTEILELDPLTLEVLSFVSGRYGAGWRLTDFSSITTKKDDLVSIALDVALPDVTRLMPFFSTQNTHKSYVEKKSSYIAQNIESLSNPGTRQIHLIGNTIERFFETQIMHPTAKAVYETAFYYVWGENSAINNNEVAIGIDRDHNSFQYIAWKQGYNNGMKKSVSSIPLLYARRIAENSEGSALKDYCIRQFWR